MHTELLSSYLPDQAQPMLTTWFGTYRIQIKITANRSSKLGDYRKVGENQFLITINSTLHPELFFFVLTHEMAHLIAFEKYGHRNIAPHGKEWKHTFREMLLHSLAVYSDEVRPLILDYAVSPKANFGASAALKKHFYPETLAKDEVFIEDLQCGETFIFKNQKYKMHSKRRKNFLCTQLASGAGYIFRPFLKVKKSNEHLTVSSAV